MIETYPFTKYEYPLERQSHFSHGTVLWKIYSYYRKRLFVGLDKLKNSFDIQLLKLRNGMHT